MQILCCVWLVFRFQITLLNKPVCDLSEKAGRWGDGSDEDREEVERALEGTSVEKYWATTPSEEQASLWKLWGLRRAKINGK